MAVISALSVTLGHAGAGVDFGDVPWILDGNYLAIVFLYTAICLLAAYLPFLSNLNWQRRIRTETLMTERRRLRREVHDNIAQTLAFLSLKAQRAEERVSRKSPSALTAKDVGDIAGAVEHAYLAVWDYLDGTDESGTEDPLGIRLTATAKQWSNQAGLPMNIEVTREELNLDSTVEQHLFQIAREALTNVGKHASPFYVWLGLESSLTEVRLRVQDDGRGFASTQPSGHGLRTMKERASMIGASLTISSELWEGTEVLVVYPRQTEQADR